jgi:hypothetical protein
MPCAKHLTQEDDWQNLTRRFAVPDLDDTDEMAIEGTLAGPLRVLIVDASLDDQGFEYSTSKYIFNELVSRGVMVNPVVRPKHFRDISSAINSTEFTALIYVAHGNPAGLFRAGTVQMGDANDMAWQLFGESGVLLTDKLVVFVVCDSDSPDMRDSVLEGSALAYAAVASEGRLSRQEAEAFVPAFFDALNKVSHATIDPLEIVRITAEHGALANWKMRAAIGGKVVTPSRGIRAMLARLWQTCRPSSIRRWFLRRRGRRNLIKQRSD